MWTEARTRADGEENQTLNLLGLEWPEGLPHRDA